MSRAIWLDSRLSGRPQSPYLSPAPGAAEYTDQLVASQVPGNVGTAIDSWGPADAGSPMTALQTEGSTTPVSLQFENGYKFLRSNGGMGVSRLLGPNKGYLPFTLAAVVRAPAYDTASIIGVNGAQIRRDPDGNWGSFAGVGQFTSYRSAGWVFVLLGVNSTRDVLFRVNDAEVTTAATGFVPSTNFSGMWFGPTVAGKQADILHMAYWQKTFLAADRLKIWEWFRSRYAVLP